MQYDERQALSYNGLYFCALFLWFLCQVVPFDKLHLNNASTNATDDHKYSPFPSQILSILKFWYISYHIHFLEKKIPFDFERAL